jgi:HD-GYP domain-containing protein (c-di-GMP phosphodiesterase class II)
MGVEESQMEHIRRGALLHDIGKMGISDQILLKAGPLNEAEWIEMRKHPTIAYDMLKEIEFLEHALDIPYFHQERWDGSGYPLGLRGEEIPLSARIFAVVDVWDALTDTRPYKIQWPVEKTARYLKEKAGVHFDPSVVTAFLELMGADHLPDADEEDEYGQAGLTERLKNESVKQQKHIGEDTPRNLLK